MSDDLFRLAYRPRKVAAPAGVGKGGKRTKTSISMDPDLYWTFVLVVGDVAKARSQLRRWATEIDGDRDPLVQSAGVSRLVQKRMLAEIRKVVDAGLKVISRDDAPAGSDQPSAVVAPKPRKTRKKLLPDPSEPPVASAQLPGDGVTDWDRFVAAQ